MKRPAHETKVLVAREIPDLGINMLKEAGFQVTVWPGKVPMTQPELIEKANQMHAILTLSADKLNAHFFQECNHLDIVSQFAAGYDNIDIPAATKAGIPVGNTPGAMSDATADIAFGLMLAVSRKFFHMHKTIGRGEWGAFQPKANLGLEQKGKTLGVFGLGAIGMEMAKRCHGAYDMEIIYCNRSHNEEAEKRFGAKKVSFDELLAKSDVISVHSILSDETRGIFNKAAFSKMKPTSIFINTSRGGTHNETDLIEALKSSTIWGAGLDVTNPEPMKSDNPLLEMENVAVLPHIGSASVNARNEMSRMAAVNIIEFYKTGKVPYIINPEVLS
ncbi:D-glycerate dehydrogenase [Imperialibacter roseus]|uniref:D-glycerate dehydrogenase n=1 Tax=Imperialibacter roseus TaxID=1324217 RepID=A0ABZ0IQN5_9BACT|nr:D-glycerate dehydrogenase [Imperialibacter roseus]WOK07368.1 D-glycerate dehydrogenase [Imperialibacter roseus]